jgi:hypothetical protein
VLSNQHTLKINMSTVRAYSNNKRISTGRSMKDGSFLQFYPEKKSFTNQNEWQSHWYNNCKAVFEEEDYADMPRLIPAGPAPAVLSPEREAARQKMTDYIAKRKSHYQAKALWNIRKNAMNQAAPPQSPVHSSMNEIVTVTETTTTTTTTMIHAPHSPMSQTNGDRIGSLISSSTQASPPASEPNPSTPPPKPTPSSPPPVSRKTKNEENKDETLKDWDFKLTNNFVAPPGTYYIGDICYFLKNNLYDGIFGGYSYESGLYTRKSDGAFFMVDHTAWGDGCYNGSDGFDYGVDAGIIGIVSRSLGPERDADVYGGKLHTFKDPVEIKFGGGLFRFKSHWDYLVIETSGDNRYNSDEDW